MRTLEALLAAFSIVSVYSAPARALDGGDGEFERTRCTRPAGALPRPDLPPGTPNPDIPIKHVIVLIQENRSFDSVFGALNRNGYEGQVDGLQPWMSNPDINGNPVNVFHHETYCTGDTPHGWDASWKQWNGGRNDGYIVSNYQSPAKNGTRAMGHYDQGDLPYYYALANRFAIGDRYFSSMLGPTFPNRLYAYAATSYGMIDNKVPKRLSDNDVPLIFHTLSKNGVSWKYYFSDVPFLLYFPKFFLKNLKHMRHVTSFKNDLRKGRLPQVVFVDSSFLAGDEHPPKDVQFGQKTVAKKINWFIQSPHWADSVLFLTYDEGGGAFDHVPPPAACAPDDILPQLKPGAYPGDFGRYGFRVPLVAVSPWAKRHHVSHATYDHSSILRFIGEKYNLPALTRRDANADPMLDLFDFQNPSFDRPELPEARIDLKKAIECLWKKGGDLPPKERDRLIEELRREAESED